MATRKALHGHKPERLSFQRIEQIIDLPNLIELQKSSYENFLDEGIREAFEDISKITDFTGTLQLEFKSHSLGEPVHSIEECQDKDLTFAKPLKVKVSLITFHEDSGDGIGEEGKKAIREVKEQEIFMGDFPCMTDKGTFVINGAERVIVSQLVRSPGLYFQPVPDPSGKILYLGMIIPNRGAWLEFENDVSDVIGVRIDRNRKIPVTLLVRALGFLKDDNDPNWEPKWSTDEEILRLFDYNKSIKDTLEKDAFKTPQEALIEIYRKLRPGDPPNLESSENLLRGLFFEPKRYNLGKVGRYKLNKKLGLRIHCKDCGAVADSGVTTCPECGGRHMYYNEIITKEDIILAIKYMIALVSGEKQLVSDDESIRHTVEIKSDDIDHLGNRRVRAVGELLQNQLRVGMLRLERVVKERMTVQDVETVTPQALINIRPVVAAIKEFFGSSQLSQFMDQTNSLSELTHKRRISALGPGGLSRERAGFEVRDVHYSHYGRICPIETPEGPNIGLIGALACFAKVDEFGFIQTPYRRAENGVVTNTIDYLSADEEDKHIVAQANTPLDASGRIIPDKVVARRKSANIAIDKNSVDYFDVSPKQVVSVATALIPFLEHDDANRALMGANMQRQGVPLIKPQAPICGTGMEFRAAKDSGGLINSKEAGTVVGVSSDCITLQENNGKKRKYNLLKFKRSNAGTCLNQRPIVRKGQYVEKNTLIADGASSENGELALGRNLLCAFMPWEGYNYEDAILISEELVQQDVFTSIHIEEYECEARETKLGAEEITRDIPNVGDDVLQDLDDEGIVRIGADVRPEDILVGKVTPKGETELTAEERLLRAIFGEKARDVRDTSLKVPHGEKGKVIDVKVFSRENNDELSPGVIKLVRVYVAQKRKILQGDKMAGRHGNKGIIAKILPIEDMPFLPSGRPVQIVLNPLGIPSRMNIGQILETHLGYAAHRLGFRVACPVFEGASDSEILGWLKVANLRDNFRKKGIYISPESAEYIAMSHDPLVRLDNYLSSLYLKLNEEDLKKLIQNPKSREKLIKDAKKKKVTITEEKLLSLIEDVSTKERIRRRCKIDHMTVTEEQLNELAEYTDLFLDSHEDAKSYLFDGRTGEPIDNRITVGQIYIMKLAHLVDDKIHARSTGPYSLITQQPLGGKAQFGGQRFGEMEVWALEAYGAAYTLQELLTVKSDDVVGRVKTYEAIVKGENVLEPGIPESFKVLIKELQSLCLDVRILSEDENGNLTEVELKGTDDDVKVSSARAIGGPAGE